MKHIRPSSFVRETRIYKMWCAVTECTKCKSLGKYEDAHPANPCRFCGHKLAERVGRWVDQSKWWQSSPRGYWELRP